MRNQSTFLKNNVNEKTKLEIVNWNLTGRQIAKTWSGQIRALLFLSSEKPPLKDSLDFQESRKKSKAMEQFYKIQKELARNCSFKPHC